MESAINEMFRREREEEEKRFSKWKEKELNRLWKKIMEIHKVSYEEFILREVHGTRNE